MWFALAHQSGVQDAAWVKTGAQAGGDRGQPAVLKDGPAKPLFHDLARRVAIGLDNLKVKQPPKIIFED